MGSGFSTSLIFYALSQCAPRKFTPAHLSHMGNAKGTENVSLISVPNVSKIMNSLSILPGSSFKVKPSIADTHSHIGSVETLSVSTPRSSFSNVSWSVHLHQEKPPIQIECNRLNQPNLDRGVQTDIRQGHIRSYQLSLHSNLGKIRVAIPFWYTLRYHI